jgi:hypothetical protein
VVDNADFKILYAHYGTGTVWTQGDFSLDGKIDFLDFQLLEANFGKVATVPVSAPAGAGVGVPEPVAIGWTGLGGMILLRRRVRK